MDESEISSIPTYHAFLKTDGQLIMKDLVTHYIAEIFIFKNSHITLSLAPGYKISDSFTITIFRLFSCK